MAKRDESRMKEWAPGKGDGRKRDACGSPMQQRARGLAHALAEAYPDANRKQHQIARREAATASRLCE